MKDTGTRHVHEQACLFIFHLLFEQPASPSLRHAQQYVHRPALGSTTRTLKKKKRHIHPPIKHCASSFLTGACGVGLAKVSVEDAPARNSEWKCKKNSRSVDGTGRLRSYLLPPGAVGALYGSGCFHFSSRLSASSTINCGKEMARQHFFFSGPFSRRRHKLFFLDFCDSSVVSLDIFPPLPPPESYGLLPKHTLCCLGSVTCLFASKRPRMYMAWPRQT